MRARSTRRPSVRMGNFAHPHAKSAQRKKHQMHLLSFLHNETATFSRAESGNRQNARGWRLSQFYGKMKMGRMNGQSLVA